MKVQKINQYFKLIINGVIMYTLVFALFVKMQIPEITKVWKL